MSTDLFDEEYWQQVDSRKSEPYRTPLPPLPSSPMEAIHPDQEAALDDRGNPV